MRSIRVLRSVFRSSIRPPAAMRSSFLWMSRGASRRSWGSVLGTWVSVLGFLVLGFLYYLGFLYLGFCTTWGSVLGFLYLGFCTWGFCTWGRSVARPAVFSGQVDVCPSERRDVGPWRFLRGPLPELTRPRRPPRTGIRTGGAVRQDARAGSRGWPTATRRCPNCAARHQPGDALHVRVGPQGQLREQGQKVLAS